MMSYTGEDVIKHLDDTHWKVYGLNKQMCDIGRLISVEEMAERYNKQILQSRLDGLSAWLKLQDMEEKKTKKMTKAEAFEWLKGTKVKCYERSNALYCELVGKITTECGCVYNGFMSPPDVSVFAIHIDAAGYIRHLCTVDADKYNELKCREISADDILSIEIVEDTKPDCERNEHVKALQELITKSGCIDCIIISKNDIGILKK